MARPSSKDPLDKFRWEIRIEGTEAGGNAGVDCLSRAGFVSVEVPSITYSTKEYAEGGRHLNPRIIVDGASLKPITLTRGVTKNKDFTDWAKLPMFILYGDSKVTEVGSFATYTSSPGERAPEPADYRRTVIINHLDRTGKVVKSYRLYNCIPVEFQPASDFSADADDGLSMEKLVLRYESFEVISSDTTDSAFNLTETTKRLFRNF